MAGTWRALLATWMVGVLLGLAGEATPAPREQILRIVALPDGAVLAPGQTFIVEVEALARRRVNAVALLSPLVGDLKEQPPFVFTLTIPPDAPLGPLSLTALTRGQSKEVFEATTTIQIETATPVESIQVMTPRLFLATQRRISVSGTFADGIRREITRSREIRYTSSNPQVATVNHEGLIEALAPGTATITIDYKGKTTTVAVTAKFENLTIPLDIEPADRTNTINLDSWAEVRVAILSTETFAAKTVHAETVRFGPGQAPPLAEDEEDDEDDADEEEGDDRGRHERTSGTPKSGPDDINGDGRPDVLLHFSVRATGLTCADTQATLTGRTVLGDRISGSNPIRVVGKACPLERNGIPHRWRRASDRNAR